MNKTEFIEKMEETLEKLKVGDFNFVDFPGGHFFGNKKYGEVVLHAGEVRISMNMYHATDEEVAEAERIMESGSVINPEGRMCVLFGKLLDMYLESCGDRYDTNKEFSEKVCNELGTDIEELRLLSVSEDVIQRFTEE